MTQKVVLLLVLLSSNALADHPPIQYRSIAEDVWAYTAIHRNIPSNGLIVDNGDSVIVVDTPWNDEQSQSLIRWIETERQKPIDLVVVTHSHDDRAGGARVFQQAGIPMISSDLTAKIVERELGVKLQSVVNRDNPVYPAGPLEVFYPGPGHTRDNVVVWLPKQRVLYGGCFFKSARTKNLGYYKEGDVVAWPKSITRVDQRYPKAALYVPGHGGWSEQGVIDNTLTLIQEECVARFGRPCSTTTGSYSTGNKP